MDASKGPESTLRSSIMAMFNAIGKPLYLLLWGVGILWMIYTAAFSVYWFTREPIDGPSVAPAKATRPHGVLVDLINGRNDFDIQKEAKGHWTLVVFSVFGKEFIAHQVGNHDYGKNIYDSNEVLGAGLTEIRRLLPREVKIWVVRLDPPMGEMVSGAFAETCIGCLDKYLLAAHSKGGRYGNYYGSVLAWLDTEWSNYSSSAWHPASSPSYAVLDTDGYIRAQWTGDGFDKVYSVLKKNVGFRAATSLPDFKTIVDRAERSSFVISHLKDATGQLFKLFFGIVLLVAVYRIVIR